MARLEKYDNLAFELQEVENDEPQSEIDEMARFEQYDSSAIELQEFEDDDPQRKLIDAMEQDDNSATDLQQCEDDDPQRELIDAIARLEQYDNSAIELRKLEDDDPQRVLIDVAARLKQYENSAIDLQQFEDDDPQREPIDAMAQLEQYDNLAIDLQELEDNDPQRELIDEPALQDSTVDALSTTSVVGCRRIINTIWLAIKGFCNPCMVLCAAAILVFATCVAIGTFTPGGKDKGVRKLVSYKIKTGWENDCGDTKKRNSVQNNWENDLPWMSRMIITGLLNYSFAGSIIHEQYILTNAFNCIHSYMSPTNYQMVVRIGQYNAHSNIDCYRSDYRIGCTPQNTDFKVKRIIMEEEKKKINNICLVKLVKRIKFSDAVYPICLPSENGMEYLPFKNNTLITTGWTMKGSGNSSQQYSQKGKGKAGIQDMTPAYITLWGYTLQKISIRTLPTNKCNYTMDEIPICASSGFAQKLCSEDCGGPLVYQSSVTGSRRNYVVGVINYFFTERTKRCFPNEPFTAIRIAPVMPWIWNKTNSNE